MAALFSLTLFVSATLLFVVQPMIAKAVLPLLGGTPAVWNTCMLFSQAGVLGGYVYAHVAITRLGARRQALLHLGILAASLALLPIGLPDNLTPPVADGFVPWLIGVLALAMGGPFFLLSASAPMLQKWFAATGHKDGKDPYFLYAASNLGSLAALLGYPLIVEPLLRLNAQTHIWSRAYGLFLLLAAACAVAVFKTAAPCPAQGPSACPPAEDIAWGRRLRWLALSLAPSSLMLGVTSFLTTDIAAVPLLWVLPLALYLLTFVFAFGRNPLPQRLMLKAQALVTIPLVISLAVEATSVWLLIPLHILGFFATAMVCHQSLVDDRPSEARLTEFYLVMSVGGMLGGVFNAIVAPMVFDRLLEYPLILAAACFLRPAQDSAPDIAQGVRSIRRDLLFPTLLAGGLFMAAAVGRLLPQQAAQMALLAAIGVAAILTHSFSLRPLRFGLAMAVLVAAVLLGHGGSDALLVSKRNFFGVVQVRQEAMADGRVFHKIVHGNTLHGLERMDAPQCRPLAYYHRSGPLGQVFAALEQRGGAGRVAAVGLGAGAVSSYASQAAELTFYEIDPNVELVARDRRYFHYLSRCAPATQVVLGDARLSMAKAPDAGYDLIILDAFSSDAIPVHLLTREAMALYLRKLAPNGILAAHISNRFLDLKPVLGALAADAGLSGAFQLYQPDAATLAERGSKSLWAVLARRPELLPADLLASAAPSQDTPARWQPLPQGSAATLWTDDFSNIVSVLSF